MATYGPTKFSTHQTLVASTVDTVTLNTSPFNVEVFNRDASSYIYFTLDGSTPVVAADGTYVVGPGQAVQVATTGTPVVKLISGGTPAYSVTGTY